MRKFLFRLMIALLSAGWIAPFSFAIWAHYDFTYNILLPLALDYGHPLHTIYPIDSAMPAFAFAMIWLTVVILGWTFYLTRKL